MTYEWASVLSGMTIASTSTATVAPTRCSVGSACNECACVRVRACGASVCGMCGAGVRVRVRQCAGMCGAGVRVWHGVASDSLGVEQT